MLKNNKNKIDTLLTHGGRSPKNQQGFVNPPAWRGSTIVFNDFKEFLGEKETIRYGTSGTPATKFLGDLWLSMFDIEDGFACFQSSGLASVAVPLLGMLKAGDHLLMTDSAYYPTRSMCDERLSNLGVEVEYYTPRIGSKIIDIIRPNTKMIFLESPGSLSFEVQDTPTITSIAREKGIITVIDDTWSSGIACNPFKLGADIAVYALSKYPMGHSDGLMGAVISNKKYAKEVNRARELLGQCPGSHEVEATLKGMRTLAVRFRYQSKAAMDIAEWLEKDSRVSQVLHPGLKSHPDHEIFKRDFKMPAGLFGFSLPCIDDEDHCRKALEDAFNNTKICKMGFSWGGYASLMIPVSLKPFRFHTSCLDGFLNIRLNVGLEDIDDIKDDVDQFLTRYSKYL